MRIGIYSADPNRFLEYAARGVTHVGPYPGVHAIEDILDACRDHGLKYIYQPSNVGTPWEGVTMSSRPGVLANVPMQSVIDHADAAVDFAMIHSDVIDEIACPLSELRYWYAPEREFLELYASVCMPSAFQFWMYQPGHYDALTLAQAKTDYTLMGCYTVNTPDRLARSAKQFRQIQQAAKFLKNKPVAGLQLSADYEMDDYSFIWMEIWRAVSVGITDFQLWSGAESRPGLSTFADQIEWFLDAFARIQQDATLFSDPELSVVAYYEAEPLVHVDHQGTEWMSPGLSHATYDGALLLVNSTVEFATVELDEARTYTDEFSEYEGHSEFLSVPPLTVMYLSELS